MLLNFAEILKGFGFVLMIGVLVALWVVPDPIGKIVEIWRFFRGE
jgi:hypothetical protein